MHLARNPRAGGAAPDCGEAPVVLVQGDEGRCEEYRMHVAQSEQHGASLGHEAGAAGPGVGRLPRLAYRR
eukprot:1398185-Lingulodinium_polyedra.AAC.1